MRGRTGRPDQVAPIRNSPIDPIDEQLARTVAAFQQSVVGQPCRLVRNGNWTADLGAARLSFGSVWRLLGSTGVIVTSTDDGQLFGLRKPFDACEKANSKLQRASVQTLQIAPQSADLQLQFNNQFRLDVLTDSSGYESWDASFAHEGTNHVLIANGGRLAFHTSPQGAENRMIKMSDWRTA